MFITDFFRACKGCADHHPLIEESILPANLLDAKTEWIKNGKPFMNPKFIYDQRIAHKNCKTAKLLSRSLRTMLQFVKNSSDVKTDEKSFLTYCLENRCQALSSIHDFLSLDMDKIKTPDSNQVLAKIYGEPTRHELDLAEEMLEYHPMEVIVCHLIEKSETPIFDHQKLIDFLDHNFLLYRNILSQDNWETLRDREVTLDETVEKSVKTVEYIVKHGGLKPGSLKVNIVRTAKRFGLGHDATLEHTSLLVPGELESKNSALNIIGTLTHELNAHYRAYVSTRALLDRCASTTSCPNLLRDLSSFIIDNNNVVIIEGHAVLEQLRATNSEGVLEIFAPLVIDYAHQGHNFAETMRYACELAINYDNYNEEIALEYAWSLTSELFFGQTDTSAHAGYVFPKEQSYFLGPLRILKEIARTDKEYSEPFYDLMRYSVLTLEEINFLDELQKRRGEPLAPDPFAFWHYGTIHHKVKNPILYLHELFLKGA